MSCVKVSLVLVFAVLTLLLVALRLDGTISAAWLAVFVPVYILGAGYIILGLIGAMSQLPSAMDDCLGVERDEKSSNDGSNSDDEEEKEGEDDDDGGDDDGNPSLEGYGVIDDGDAPSGTATGRPKRRSNDGPLSFKLRFNLNAWTTVTYLLSGIYLIVQAILIGVAVDDEEGGPARCDGCLRRIGGSKPDYGLVLLPTFILLVVLFIGTVARVIKDVYPAYRRTRYRRHGADDDGGSESEDESRDTRRGKRRAPVVTLKSAAQAAYAQERLGVYVLYLAGLLLYILFFALVVCNLNDVLDNRNWWLTFVPVWVYNTALGAYIIAQVIRSVNGSLEAVVDAAGWTTAVLVLYIVMPISVIITEILMVFHIESGRDRRWVHGLTTTADGDRDQISWQLVFMPLYITAVYCILVFSFPCASSSKSSSTPGLDLRTSAGDMNNDDGDEAEGNKDL